MPYKPNDIPETASILGIAFVVGIIAQYLRQKTDPNHSTANFWWYSIASGFSAMVVIGLLYEYTPISGAFLVAVSGLAGWAGFSILSTLSKALDQLLIKGAEKKLDVSINKPIVTEQEEVDDERTTDRTTSVNSQLE